MKTYESRVIWDLSRIPDRDETRMELTSLIRFRDHWYCAFREAESHWNHPSGRGRVIRSADGEHWESVIVLDWEGADVREPKLSITPEGRLMVNTVLYFVSREPRLIADKLSLQADAPQEAKPRREVFWRLEPLDTTLNIPLHDDEPWAVQQNVTWFSEDGLRWESATADPSGVNTWRWDTTWYQGMAYSLAQWGKDMHGTLYRSRDGKNWRELKRNFCPGGKCNEGAFAFDRADQAYCLLRHGVEKALLGTGRAPYYQEWKWSPLQIDWDGSGNFLPASEVLRVSLGGPVLRTLSDGRIVAAGRGLGPGQDDGRIALFWLDPERARLTRFAEVDGTSYAGVWEHEGALWVSSARSNVKEILFAKVPLDPAS
jgi:hypothetical protein